MVNAVAGSLGLTVMSKRTFLSDRAIMPHEKKEPDDSAIEEDAREAGNGLD